MSARRMLIWSIVGSICRVATAEAGNARVFERPPEIEIYGYASERAGELYDALDVTPVISPPQCYAEMECIPELHTKSVSSGDARLSCDTCRQRPCGAWEACRIEGRFGPPPLGFAFEGYAAEIITRALDRVGNPFVAPDGFSVLSCRDGTCLLQVTITEYWLDYNNFFYALHEYGGYGRTVLKPFFVNDDGEAFYDVLAVPEDIRPGDIAIKRLRAGALDIVCYRAIASYYLYPYRCTWDVPYSGTLPYPVDVISTLLDDAAATLYGVLDLPGPTKVFETADGLYSLACTAEQCDFHIRRPIPN